MYRNLIGATLTVTLAACGGGADPQNPPITGHTDIEQWLTAGVYKEWKCEAAVHANRSPSPHGKNRICSNALLSGHTTGEYPVGDVADIGFGTAPRRVRGR